MGTTKRERQKAGRQARLEAARAAEQRARRNRTIITGAVLAVLIVGGLFLFARLGKKDKGEVATGTTTTTSKGSSSSTPDSGSAITGETPCPPTDGSATRTTFFALAPPMCIDPNKSYAATFKTTEGDITAVLDTTTTPGVTNNFVVLALYHYYDNTKIFRTDTSIGIVQGGSPTTQDATDPGPGYTIKDEGGTFDFTANGGQGKGPFTYETGDLVMARASGADTSAAQYFFGVNDNVKNLDATGTYLKFGKVTAGQDVLTKILALDNGGKPSKDVIVNTVTIKETGA